jgi:hypothetical protein
VTENILRQEYRVLTEAEKTQIKAIKDIGQAFIDGMDMIGTNREFSLAKTKMEEAVMWATKGITN